MPRWCSSSIIAPTWTMCWSRSSEKLGAELRGRRMGARVGAAELDPRHGRLFRAPRQLQPLYRKAGALRAHGHHLGGGAGRVPRGRPYATARCARAQAGLACYMASGFDPNGPRDIVFVLVGLNYDRCSRTASSRRQPLRPRGAPALCVQPHGAVRLAAQPVAQAARRLAPLRLRLRQLRSAVLAQGLMSLSAVSTFARYPSSKGSARSSGWGSI